MKSLIYFITFLSLLAHAEEPSSWVESRNWQYTVENTEGFCHAESAKEDSAFTKLWNLESKIMTAFPEPDSAQQLPEVQIELTKIENEEAQDSTALEVLLSSDEAEITVEAYGVSRSRRSLVQDAYFYLSNKTDTSFTFTFVYNDISVLEALLTEIRLKGSLSLQFLDSEGEDLSLSPEEGSRAKKVQSNLSLAGSSKALEGLSICLGKTKEELNSREARRQNYFLLSAQQIKSTFELITQTNSESLSPENLEELEMLTTEGLIESLQVENNYFFNSDFTQPQKTEEELSDYLASQPYKNFKKDKKNAETEISTLEAVTITKQNTIKESESTIKNSNKSLEENNSELSDLQAATDDLKSKRDSAEAVYRPIKEKRDPIVRKASQSWWAHSRANDKLNGLKTQKSNEESSITNSNSRIQEIDKDSKEKTAALPGAEKSETEAFEELSAFDFETFKQRILNNSSREIRNLENQVSNLTSENTQLSTEIRDLENQMRDVRREFDDTEKDLPNLSKLIEQVNSLIEVADDRLLKRRSELVSLDQDFRSKSSAKDDAQEELEDWDQEIASSEEELARAEERLDRIKERIKRLERQLDREEEATERDRLKDQISNLEEERKPLRREKRKITENLETIKTQREQSLQNLKEKTEELALIEDSIADKKQIFEQMSDLINATSSEISLKVIWTCSNPRSENSFCSREIDSLRSSLSSLEGDFSRQKSSIERLNSSLQRDLESLTDSKDTAEQSKEENETTIRQSEKRLREIEDDARQKSITKQDELRSAYNTASSRVKSLRLLITELSKEKLTLQESIIVSRQNISLLIGEIADQEKITADLLSVRDKDALTRDTFDRENNFESVEESFEQSKSAHERNLKLIAETTETIQTLEKTIVDAETAKSSAEQWIESAETRILELLKLISDELEPAIMLVDEKIKSFEDSINAINQERAQKKAIRDYILENLGLS